MRYAKDPLSAVRLLASHSEQPEANANRIMLKLRVAYEKLKAGTEDDDQFDQLAAVINVGAVRAESIAPEAVETMTAGVMAMANCARIQLEHGRYGFHPRNLFCLLARPLPLAHLSMPDCPHSEALGALPIHR